MKSPRKQQKNGNKKGVSNFKEGKLDGLLLSWYENGQKELEAKFKGGTENGQWSEWWHGNEQKSLEITFKNGKMNGPSTRWHKNGNKSAESIFKDDEVIEGSQKYWKSEGELVESAKEAGLE